MIARALHLALAAMLATAVLAGCPAPETSANADGAANPSKPLLQLAGVERFDIVVLESQPVQVRVVVYGWMADACTTIRNFEQTRDDDVIFLRIITSRPSDVMCAQVIKRFRETFPLETKDLAPGTYLLDVSGKTQEFTLP
ncbi:MAG: hypothetical protein JSU82_00455 [Rhodospirillales bacterium]|nr:MAG: hypothetical protein JSU82_15900 [Rhodospirillales bacterium]UCH74370.1 MAG: hypothetical protein JSU82_00455 [Rhodospirillales bacterium]